MAGRIRTLKPDFFRSPDTAAVDFPVRIFYAAMWCWADDFGIGETNLNGLLGFAFPDSDEFTAQDLRGFCADVAQHYEVTFYTVRGRHYFAIPSWEKHQKLERRAERRKNPPPDDPDAAPDLRFQPRADSAPESRRKSGAGTGEREGEREAELEEPPYPPADEPAPRDRLPARTNNGGGLTPHQRAAELNKTARSAAAYEIAQGFSRALPVPIESGVLIEFGQQIDKCLKDHIPPEAIAEGMRLWAVSDSWSPTQIPRFVAKASARAGARNGIGKPTEKALDYDAAAEQLIAALENQA